LSHWPGNAQTIDVAIAAIHSGIGSGRGQRGLDLTCLIDERLRLDRFPATASPTFFPC